MPELCLLTVHAHPDDEASKGAATVAKYSDEGIKSVLVCCTGGEEGKILNENDSDQNDSANNSNGERVREIRAKELQKSADIIGYDVLEFLGYRDSGMPDSEANNHPDAFVANPLEEAIERLVKIIRREKPYAIVTYSDDQQGYQHPDHIRVHDISKPAFHLAGDKNAFPDAGEPFAPSKLYYTVWSRERVVALHEKFLELNLKSPYEGWGLDRHSQDNRVTTRIEVGKWYDRRCDSLLAHASQVDSESPFWFGLPRDVASKAYPYDDYILAESLVETKIPEDDFFAGLR